MPPLQQEAALISAVARSDSHRVYVLDQLSGNIFAIDTFSDAIVGTANAGAGGNYLYYDQPRNRIYIANPATHQMAVFAFRSIPHRDHRPHPCPLST